ncbi:hypothetical protein Bsp3421_000131 (plasmid) [Burkholderia sp. FERM BP-3421]|uniref:hypothetical protein n=1 Tax=Burkholderia sp. FERM BP-3421 TaxID=1494466 RepID=UPI0023609C4B|nr:hypothetical protein [Burkholderia sp. FERM BP-3421]WDD90306.1 hypothetical protein Bsp3421_000131 [Burkholderia sp. FERM BP-3421]
MILRSLKLVTAAATLACIGPAFFPDTFYAAADAAMRLPSSVFVAFVGMVAMIGVVLGFLKR